MSQRNGERAALRRGLVPPARVASEPATAPVLATLSAEDLAGLMERETALQDAQQAAADANLELEHFRLTLRKRYGWKVPTVSIDTTTGEIRAHNA